MISYDELRFLRLEKGLSQKEVAEKVNIATNTLSDYENGKVIPNIEIFQKILHVLGYELSTSTRSNYKDFYGLEGWYVKPNYQLKHDMMVRHGPFLDYDENGYVKVAYVDFIKECIKKGILESFWTGHFISYKGTTLNFFHNGLLSKKGRLYVRLYMNKQGVVMVKKAIFNQQKLVEVTNEWATLEEINNHFYLYIKYAKETEVHIIYRQKNSSIEYLNEIGKEVFEPDIYDKHLPSGFAKEER